MRNSGRRIIAMVIITALVTMGGCSNNTGNSKNSSSKVKDSASKSGSVSVNTNKKKKDAGTKEGTKLEIKTCGRFGSPALGISYLTPYGVSTGDTLETIYGEIIPASVDKAFGSYDYSVLSPAGTGLKLEEIPQASVSQLDGTRAYNFHENTARELNIKTKENVKVNGIDALLYTGDYEKYDKTTHIAGYALYFNDKPINVMAEWMFFDTDAGKEDEYTDLIMESIKVVAESLETYNGEGYYELDPNFNFEPLYANGISNDFLSSTSLEELNKQKMFVITHGKDDHPDYFLNVIDIKSARDNIDFDKEKLEDLFPDCIKYAQENDRYMFADSSMQTVDITNTEKVTIDGIDMMKYMGNMAFKDGSGKKPFVVYAFLYDGLPYILQMNRIQTNAAYAHYSELTDDEKQILLKDIEYNADVIIRTFRPLKDGEDPMKYHKFD